MNEIKNVFVIHLTGWILISLLFFWIFSGEGLSNTFFVAGIMILCAIPIFYSHYYILTHYWNKKRFGLYVVGLILIYLVWSISLNWVYKIFNGIPEQFPIIIFSAIVSGVANGIKNWFNNALKKEKLEKQSIQAELTYLKSQINPHFLFNTLSNIHALAYKNSSLTPEAILRLSSLMRYMLYESSGELVALEREINYLKDYINLQQLRYRNESIVDLQIIGDPKDFNVAPLLFIHLLENAFKHSPAKLNSGDIKVGIGIKEDSLTFNIQNPIRSKMVTCIDEQGGIGLSNVKRRLQLLYEQHTFEITNTEEVFNVFLEINRL